MYNENKNIVVNRDKCLPSAIVFIPQINQRQHLFVVFQFTALFFVPYFICITVHSICIARIGKHSRCIVQMHISELQPEHWHRLNWRPPAHEESRRNRWR